MTMESLCLIIPIMFFFVYWPMQKFFKCRDQGTCCKAQTYPEVTQCKTIQAYIELYRGEDFLIFYQYAHILIVVFMCFMFGPVMPILFPLGFVAIIVLFVSDRLLLAYYHK